jgi:uncharacterized repeat protein (TIGR01451 family)
MGSMELRLQKIAAELEDARETLHEAVDEYRRAIRKRRARRRRLAALAALSALLSVGFSTADTASFGAGETTVAASSCAPGSSAIGNASFDVSGDTAVARFTVLAGCGETQVSFASYKMLSGPDNLFPQVLFDSDSHVLSEGQHSMTIHIPDCFWQIDLATGPVLPTIDENNLYGSRLAIALHGGGATCAQTPPGTTTATTGTTTTAPTTTTSPVTTTTTTTTTTATTPTATTPTATTTTQAPVTAPPVVPSTTDVSITKVADKTDATVGQQVTYLITVTNNGPAAALDVTVVDPLPTQETLVSVSDPACTGTSVITCSFGTLEVGATRSVTVVTLAKDVGAATNTATVSTTTPESNLTNNQAQTTVNITNRFTPPTICVSLKLVHTPLVAGRKATVGVHVVSSPPTTTTPRVVELRGPGISPIRKKTDASGHARFTVRPSTAGVLQVRALRAPSCRVLSELPVAGVFKPPAFTG